MHIACGAHHSLAVTEGKGEVLAWGGNRYGQVGDGSFTDRARPVSVIGSDVRAVAAGKHHSLAITRAGEVLAWGSNEGGLLLGSGADIGEKQARPTMVPVGGGARAIAAGLQHSLVVTETGEVLAWGANDYGQLGDGSVESRRSPVRVALPSTVRAVAAGWYHSIALTEAGEVFAWGFNAPDHTKCRATTSPTLLLRGGVRTVVAGGVHSLALTETGNVLAWGGNEYGQVGDGTTEQRLLPTPVASNVACIGAGDYHSVIINDVSHHILQWGFAVFGQLGCSSSWAVHARPAEVNFGFGAFDLTAGGIHNLVVSTKGEVFSWGGNAHGQLGIGTTADRAVPVTVLPCNTVETVPREKIIEEILKGPSELTDDEVDDVFAGHCEQEKRVALTLQPANTVPELFLRMEGHNPRSCQIVNGPV